MRIPPAGFLLALSLTGSVFLSQSLAQETAVPRTNVERAGVGATDGSRPASAEPPAVTVAPAVAEPPDSFFAKFRDDNRDTARKFYKKYLDIKGAEGAGGRSVRCDFAGDQEQLAKLKHGDEVKVQGTCKGKQGTGESFTVLLDNCKLIK